MDAIKQIVGRNIQKYRKIKKLTQEQLAEMINLETISLSRIETGKNYPTSENLSKISKILNVDPYEFFIFEQELTNTQILEEIYNKIECLKNDTTKLKMINNIIKSIL